MQFDINYWSVLVAALAGWVVGAVWYSPALFAKPWLKALGKRQGDNKGGAGKAMGIGFLVTLLTAYVLAHFVQAVGAIDWMEGAQLGFWAWLGFVFTRTMLSSVFEGRSWKLFCIGTFHDLVVFLVMGGILGYWQ